VDIVLFLKRQFLSKIFQEIHDPSRRLVLPFQVPSQYSGACLPPEEQCLSHLFAKNFYLYQSVALNTPIH